MLFSARHDPTSAAARASDRVRTHDVPALGYLAATQAGRDRHQDAEIDPAPMEGANCASLTGGPAILHRDACIAVRKTSAAHRSGFFYAISTDPSLPLSIACDASLTASSEE